jgi:hypothetical protein
MVWSADLMAENQIVMTFEFDCEDLEPEEVIRYGGGADDTVWPRHIQHVYREQHPVPPRPRGA